MRSAAKLLHKEAQNQFENGGALKADEAFQNARELNALANTTARLVIRNHRLFGVRYLHALQQENWEVADAYAVEAIQSPYADEALKIACVRALQELCSLQSVDKEIAQRTHHRHAVNAVAGVGASPVVWTGGVSSSDRAMYIRNLRDSGYNPKNNFNASGNVVTQ
jgi:hypothetical protein